VLSLRGVAAPQSYQLRPVRWLAARHVDKEEQPLKERVHLVKVQSLAIAASPLHAAANTDLVSPISVYSLALVFDRFVTNMIGQCSKKRRLKVSEAVCNGEVAIFSRERLLAPPFWD
jgi:hypothetical protein